MVVVAQELPTSVRTCQKDTPDYSSCLRLAIQESWPTFVKGMPEFDLPILDPYYAERHEGAYESGEIKGHLIATDVRTYGLQNSRFLAVRPNHEDNHFSLEVDMEIPKILIEGDYKAEGSLGSFKMGGKGFFNISMEDVKTTWALEGPVEDDRWVVKHFRVAPEVGKMNVWFSDLFSGNEELNRAAMSFVNEYWPVIYRGMLPYLVETWDKEFTELVNRFFSKVPFSKIFP